MRINSSLLFISRIKCKRVLNRAKQNTKSKFLSSLFFLMFCLFLMKRISIMNIKLSNSLTRASLIKLLLSFQKDCFHRDHLDEITKDIENTHKYHVRFLFC